MLLIMKKKVMCLKIRKQEMAEASNFFVTAKEEILSVLDASVSGQLTSLSNIAGT